ncbi:hypothetical protein ACWELJ_25860 [Nocardia sp. NPDC004582]
MGSRSKTLLFAPDGRAVYYSAEFGGPEFHVPRLGEWVLSCAREARPLSVQAWDAWGMGTECEPQTTVSRRPADTSPLQCEHIYTVTITDAGDLLLCYQFTPWWDDTDQRSTELECDSVPELLTAGIEYTARLRRWIEADRNRNRQRRTPHGDHPPTAAAAEYFLSRAIECAAAYAALTAAQAST